MELPRKKRRFEWLKSVDQISVPVSMHYEGDSSKSTRVGGLVSIVGILLVGAFFAGAISMYLAFNNVYVNTSTTGIDPLYLRNCNAADNQCIQLNGTTFMPFVHLKGDPANYSAYMVPEFYSFERFYTN